MADSEVFETDTSVEVVDRFNNYRVYWISMQSEGFWETRELIWHTLLRVVKTASGNTKMIRGNVKDCNNKS